MRWDMSEALDLSTVYYDYMLYVRRPARPNVAYAAYHGPHPSSTMASLPPSSTTAARNAHASGFTRRNRCEMRPRASGVMSSCATHDGGKRHSRIPAFLVPGSCLPRSTTAMNGQTPPQ